MQPYVRRNEMAPELAGIHAFNADAPKDAPARGTMFTSHFAQRPVLIEGEPRLTQNIDSEFGKYTLGVRMPEDGTIVAVIPRFPRTAGTGGVDTKGIPCENYVFYRSHETGEMSYFILPYYKSYHSYFGFRLEYKEAADQIREGAFFPKGTVFADTPANMGDHTYTFGRNLNLAIMSHPNVTLDGYVISESAVKKFKCRLYERRSTTIGANTFLLNIYPQADGTYGAFPQIGDPIREDGLLFVKRRFNALMSPATQSVKDLQTIDHLFDEKVYTRAGKGRVVDVIVTKTDNINRDLPEQMTEVLERYSQADQHFFKQILSLEEKLVRERKRDFGDEDINVSRMLNRLFTRCMGDTNAPVSIYGKDGVRLNAKRTMSLTTLEKSAVLDNWRVEIVIEYDMIPTLGWKIAGSHGDKGVICRIEKDENMPVDKDGNRADIISGPDSVTGRMNIGRLAEPYFNAAARDVRREILEKSGLGRHRTKLSREELLSMPQDAYDYFVSEYLRFHWVASPPMAKEFEEYLNDEERVDWLLDYVNDRPYLFRTLDTPVLGRSPEGQELAFDDEKVEAIERHWNLVYDKVTYRTRTGEVVESEHPVRIMPLTVMLLDKIADQWLAVDIGKLSIFGLQAPRNDGDKHGTPYKRTPPRTVGETEGSLYTLYGGREMIAETLDRNGSLRTQMEIARNIFHSDNPTNIENIVDRTQNPLGKYRPLQIVKHTCDVVGIEIGYDEEKA